MIATLPYLIGAVWTLVAVLAGAMWGYRRRRACNNCEIKDKQFSGLLLMAHGFICENPDQCKAPCKWTRFASVALTELVPSAFVKPGEKKAT